MLNWRKMRYFYFIIALCLITLMGCGTESAHITQESADNSEVLTITGLGNEDVEITVADVMKYEPVTDDVVAVDSAGKEETYHIKGALFSDILESYHVSQNDLYAIRLVAGDGYQIEVPLEVLQTRDIILAYEINGEPLDEKTKPLRVVIPDERAMYWVRNLITIEILERTISEEAFKIVFMETAFRQIPQEDYTYYEDVDKAIKITDLMTQFEIEPSELDTVYFQAIDGLEKNETGNIFVNSYLKITGEDAPLFLSPDMPKGMYVKNILYCKVADTIFVNTKAVSDHYTNASDSDDFIMDKMLNELGMVPADTYFIVDIDGNSIEVHTADLASSVVTINSLGGINLEFSSQGENHIVKNVLMIEKKISCLY